MTYLKNVLLIALTLCLCLLGPSFGQAQTIPDRSCGTVEPQLDDLKKHKPTTGNLKIDPIIAPICNPTGVIPVVLHVISDLRDGSTASGSCTSQDSIYTKDDAACAMTDLNTFFPIPGVTFRLADYDINGVMVNGMTQRRSAFTHNASLLNRSAELARFPANAYLNIWVVNRANANNSSGFAFYPEQTAEGIVMANFAMCGHANYNPDFSTTLVHEVGHWLGLRHIWGDGNGPGSTSNCSEDDSDFLQDFINGPFEPCDCIGTPAQIEGDTPQTNGFDSNELACTDLYEGCEDANGDPLVPGPLQTNFMDYTCNNNSFTPWQICIMTSVLGNPIAQNGRLEVLQSTPFCDAVTPAPSCGLNALMPMETVFYEASNNVGQIANAIVVQIGSTTVTGNITATTNVPGVNPFVTYHTGATCNYLVVNLDDVPNLISDITFNLTIFATFTPMVLSTTITGLTIEAIEDQNCNIRHLDYEPNQSADLNGDYSQSVFIPFLTDLSYLNLSVTGNTFSFTGQNNLFPVEISSAILTAGETVGPNLAYTSDPVSFPVNVAGTIQYIGYRVTSNCGTPYYGWIRLYVPEECTSQMRMVDAATQTAYATSILAGQTNCDCNCERSVFASSHSFNERTGPGNEDTYEPIRLIIESVGCAAATTPPFVVNADDANFTVANGETEIVIAVNPGTVAPFSLDVALTSNDCVSQVTEFTFESNQFLDDFNCVPLNYTITEEELVKIDFNSDFSNFYFDLDPDANSIDNRTGTNDVVMAGSTSVLSGHLFNYSSPQDIEDSHVFSSTPLAIGVDHYLPFIISYECEDERLGYLHFTVDCNNDYYLYGFMLANNSHFPNVTTNPAPCAGPAMHPGWEEETFTAEISNDEVCFETDNNDYTFAYAILNSDNWIEVVECVDIDDLDPCEIYEYRMLYVCEPYESEWSDEIFTDTLNPTFTLTETCFPIGDDPMENVTGNSVTISYLANNANIHTTYTIEVFGGLVMVYTENNGSGIFNFDLPDCGMYIYNIVVHCCPDISSVHIWDEFEIPCEPSCDSDISAMTFDPPNASTVIVYPFGGPIGTFEIRWRKLNTPPSGAWMNSGEVTSNQADATDLIDCSDYEIQLRVQCADGTWSDWSVSTTFESECCAPIACQSAVLEASGSNWEITDANGNVYSIDNEFGWPCDLSAFGDIIEAIIAANTNCDTDEVEVCLNQSGDDCLLSIENSPIEFAAISNTSETSPFDTDGTCHCDCEQPIVTLYISRSCENRIRLKTPDLEGQLIQWRGRLVGTDQWTLSETSTNGEVWFGAQPYCSQFEIEQRIECEEGSGIWSEWYRNHVHQTIAKKPEPSTLSLNWTGNLLKVIAGFPGECFRIRWRINQLEWLPFIPFTDEEAFIIGNLTPDDEVCFELRRMCEDSDTGCPTETISGSCSLKECITIRELHDEKPECNCDYVFLTDLSGSVDGEELAALQCAMKKTMNDINKACAGCSSQFAIVAFGGTEENDIISPFSCDPIEGFDLDVEVYEEMPDVTAGLGYLYQELEAGQLNQGTFDLEHDCLKVILLTEAGCEGFEGEVQIDGTNYTSADLAEALETAFGAEISMIHYNNYKFGVLTNSLQNCEEDDGIVSDPNGETIEQDYDCESYANIGGSKSLSSDDIYHYAYDQELATIIAFPNPFDNALNFSIQVERNSEAQLLIFNASGQKVLSQSLQLDSGENLININVRMPSGAYYYDIRIDGEIYTGKLLKI